MSDGEPAIDPSLERFFATTAPWLKGEGELTDLEGALGPSSSGQTRLVFYRRLMRANVHRVLLSLYGPVQRALDHHTPGAFARYADAFDRRQPPGSWDLNAFGEGFPAFLAERLAADGFDPRLGDVADWGWTRYALARAEGPEHKALAVPCAVRSYGIDAPTVWAGLADDASFVVEDGPLTLLAWRAANGRVLHRRAAAEELLALADSTGQLDDATRAAVTESQLDAGRRALQSRGLLRAEP